jgi:SAM-dependent methyltransferase
VSDVNAYRAEPTAFADIAGKRCPVFSQADDYIRNYDRISSDHLAAFRSKGINPFMEEKFWSECESATAALVREFTRPGGRVLDVGCGMGRLLSRLPEHERFGMDISAGYLEHAVAQSLEVCLAKVEDMPYVDGFFDTVVCTDVLEHVIDLNAAVTQLFRVTKQGGHLVVRVPYRENLAPYLDPAYPYALAHLRNFDEHSLRLLFEKVYRAQVVGEVRGPYLASSPYLKFRLRPRPVAFGLRTCMRAIGLVSEPARQWLTRLFFLPVEINVVVRKS